MMNDGEVPTIRFRARLRWWLLPALRVVQAGARVVGWPSYPLAFRLAAWLVHHGVVVTLET